MSRWKKLWIIMLVCLPGFMLAIEEVSGCKVLVVMGFQENFFRTVQIRAGLEEGFTGQCELHYSYLNALSDPQDVETRAQAAYAQYQELQPDAVIASNDDAQTHFVIPYLKDQVDTPVIFCDTWGSPDTFGYPASNVTGVVRRPPISDAIVFTQQLDPSIQTIGFLFARELTSDAIASFIKTEQESYPVEALDPTYVSTFDEALAAAATLKDQCDALFIGPIGSLLVDAEGNPIPMPTLVTQIAENFGKPTLTIWKIVVESGALCAVADFGQEQGQLAADMVMKILEGTPISELAITQNQFGQRILNKTVLTRLLHQL